LKKSSLEDQKTKKFINFEINIIDTGTGITPEGQEKLFINFGKLSEHAAQNKSGTGLGLSICKQIIEQMGGEVNCESELGKGTQFKIKLSCPSLLSQS
jgi:signal transduction histidine kinase